MADDFKDIIVRMRAYDEVAQLFFYTVGVTLYQCQAFEDRLRQYKLMVYELRPGMTPEQIDEMLAKSRKRDTLGSLLKDLAKKIPIEEKAKALLDEFLAERNWFIHHFEYQHGTVVFDWTALQPVVERMRDLQQRSIHLQKQFGELAVAWTERQGISRDEIDAAIRAALERSMKPLPS